MNKVTAEISHEELMHAWAPIADVSTMLDKIKAAGVDDEIIVVMDDKVKRALEPLKECSHRIEKENPDRFS